MNRIQYPVDPYDDQGALLQGLDAGVRDAIKSASEDLSDRINTLADAEFGLVMVVPGVGDTFGDLTKMRKFACVDAGNIAQSIFYLTQVHNILPPEAVKVAACNLIVAARDFDMDPPSELMKLAGSENPSADTNVVALSVTDTIPTPVMEKTATLQEDLTAEGESGVYTALDHLDANTWLMTGWEKRALAKDILSAIDTLDLQIGHRRMEKIEKLAGDAYAADLGTAIICRELMCVAEEDTPEAYHKVASDSVAYSGLYHRKDSMDPDDFAQRLEDLDKASGLYGRHGVPDAVYSTFGKVGAAPDYSFDHSGQSVDGETLRWLSEKHRTDVGGQFGEAFADAFQKSPVALFKSMPLPQKLVLMRMASQRTPAPRTGGGAWPH